MSVRFNNVTMSHGSSGFSLGPLTMQIDQGVTALVGLNGAGKSTFMRAMYEVGHLKDGSIEINGVRLVDRNSRSTTVTRRIAYLPQRCTLPDNSRVEDFLGHICWMKSVPREDRATDVDRVLSSVHLQGCRRRRVKALSGGMRRRLEIAATLVGTPSVVLLDEPSTGLDFVQKEELYAICRGIGDSGVVIVSSHSLDEVQKISSRAIVLADGQLTYHGPRPDGEDPVSALRPYLTR